MFIVCDEEARVQPQVEVLWVFGVLVAGVLRQADLIRRRPRCGAVVGTAAAGPGLSRIRPAVHARYAALAVSGAALTVFITTFIASTVEAIEMVTIVVGVGATRGWRATWMGVAAGLAVLAVVVAVFGLALSSVPIGPLRLVIGFLLLVFGLQWLRKGIRRVAAHGFAGVRSQAPDDSEHWTGTGIDWTAFVLAFKGVLLEGLEIAFIVVSVGVAAHELGTATVGATAALVVTAAAGAAAGGAVARVPRSFLQLVVGILLTTFGTFWSLEGLGVEWPAGDLTILALVVLFAVVATAYIGLERRHVLGFNPGT